MHQQNIPSEADSIREDEIKLYKNRIFEIEEEFCWCDILIPCFQNNKFQITINQIKYFEIIEISTCYCCRKYWCCNSRGMKLELKKNEQTICRAERKFRLPCSNLIMTVYNGDNKKIGELFTSQENQNKQNEVCFIIQKPNQKRFVITKNKRDIQTCLHQCCCPHQEIKYNIFEILDQINQRHIGLISNQFQDCKKEYCTRGDKFTIQQFFPNDQDEDTVYLFIYACIEINQEDFDLPINCP